MQSEIKEVSNIESKSEIPSAKMYPTICTLYPDFDEIGPIHKYCSRNYFCPMLKNMSSFLLSYIAKLEFSCYQLRNFENAHCFDLADF